MATDGKLEDLEVLSIGSDPIDKTSEEAADKEKIADAAGGARQCPLVAAVVAAEAAKAEKEKVAAVAAEEAAAAANEAEDQRWQKGQRIKTKGLLEMKAAKKDNRKVVETVEEKSERLKQGIEQRMW